MVDAPQTILDAQVFLNATPAKGCVGHILHPLGAFRASSTLVSGSLGLESSGGHAPSFADVATFEAGLHGAAWSGSRSPHLHEVVPVSVANPVKVSLDTDTMEDIFKMAEEFSSLAVVFRFRGFWPSLADLHAWITKHWEPILDHDVEIFPNGRGFFIVRFASSEDRKTILCKNKF